MDSRHPDEILPHVRRLTHRSFMGNRSCTALTTDCDNKEVMIPRINKNELTKDPILELDSVRQKMNTEQLAYYSRLNTGMKDFEIKRDGVGY
jgi:hypothetical protein